MIDRGSIISIRGSVVDVCFPKSLPEPKYLLKAGDDGRVALEVMTYLSSEIVRTIALTPTQGLARGSQVINTGHPLQVPVGEAALGRMFNVSGEPIDGLEPLCDSPQRSLYGVLIPLRDRATTTDIFLTGISKRSMFSHHWKKVVKLVYLAVREWVRQF